jgi:hypothetical protein
VAFEKGQSGNPAGKPRGAANKATSLARTAIAQFVEGNVERLNGWLQTIAEGTPSSYAMDEQGNQVVDKWLIKPDPRGAFDCLMNVCEYHIPKLARTEMTGKDGKDLIPENITIILKKPDGH